MPESDPSSVRRRHSPAVRRRLIVDAARACIERDGLRATTVRTIAAQAGVSTGTITHHFASVDGLLGDVLAEASERFTEGWLSEVRSLPDAIARMRHVVDANLPGTAEILPLWRLWLDAWAAAARDPAVARVHAQRHASERETIRDLIAEGVADGTVRREVDPAAAAAEFLGLLDGLGLQAVIGDPEVNSERARELLHAWIDARLARV